MDAIIQTKRLRLRKWTENDIPHLVRMNQDKEVMRYFLDTITEQQSIDFYHRVQRHFQDTGYGLYVVEEVISGAFSGLVERREKIIKLQNAAVR
jgi:ribosomal-protein-alanine N-acetyltransferase